MYYYNGDIYKGAWKNDMRNGRVLILTRVAHFTKVNGLMIRNAGQGVFDWKDGSKYDGAWSNNYRMARHIFLS